MVVRSEQIAQIVDQCQLQRVGTRVQVRRQIDLVGRPQNPGDLLPVDTDAEDVDALLAEDQPPGGVALLQRQLAPDSQLARKEQVALPLDMLQRDLAARRNQTEGAVKEAGVVRDVLKTADAVNAEVPDKVHCLNLHVIGQLVLFTLEYTALFNVLVHLVRLPEQYVRLNDILAGLHESRNVQLAEGMIAEESAVGPVNRLAVDRDVENFRCLAGKEQLLRHVICQHREGTADIHRFLTVERTGTDVQDVAVLLLQHAVKPVGALVKRQRIFGRGRNRPLAGKRQRGRQSRRGIGGDRMRCSVVDDYQAAPRREGVLPEEGIQLTGHDIEHLAAAPDVGILCFGGGVDEVVHGKCSLINKMPGDYELKFAGIRAFLGYMMAHPGKKLLFMGQEFAQAQEWSEARELDWYLLEDPNHKKIQDWVKALLHLYRNNRCLYEQDTSWAGFEWINADDKDRSIFSFVRKSKDGKNNMLFVINFTPVARDDYRVGVPKKKTYHLVLNSEDPAFNGTDTDRKKSYKAVKSPCDGRKYSFAYPLPAYGVAVFKY